MQPYKLSFTAASLVLSESIKIAEVYLETKDWDQTFTITIANNLLQSRTLSRSKRMTREIILRLKNLTEAQLTLLVEGSLEEQRLLLWYCLCKTYTIIREFAQEVLHEKFLTMDMTINEQDLIAFYMRKMDMHPQLEKITSSTQKKIQSQIFRMLRDANLINQDNRILRMIPTAPLAHALAPDRHFAFQIYPAFPREFEV